jgi:HSP20 family protein
MPDGIASALADTYCPARLIRDSYRTQGQCHEVTSMTTTKSPQTSQTAETKEGGGQAEQQRRGAQAEQQTRQMARWNPFSLLDDLQDELARVWGRPLGTQMPRPTRLLAQLPLGTPRLDMYEQDGALVVKADMPGVNKDDVRVELDGGDLVIQGETRTENEAREDQYYRMERRVGSFYRRIPLPFEAKPDDIQATINDGVLEVRIPKPPESQQSRARRIPVR